jgi:glucose/arabinose dehydrogenase
MARLRLFALMVPVLLTACTSATGGPHAGSTATPSATTGAPSVVLVPFLAGYAAPVYITSAHDGSHRLFVVEQAGKIQLIDAHGAKVARPFLDITSLVLQSGERGLLSVAFHPHYAQNGLFYVYYTDHQGVINVVRYHVSSDPNVADPASGQVILQIPHPVANHNGGQMQFGPDGYLYIGVGDGGEGNSANGQRKSVLLGKLLRIDIDHPAEGRMYAIPASNPYRAEAGTRPEIWAYGLRNPWRFSFDRANGDLYIADVGAGALEEIDVQAHGDQGGENYGWDVWEGTNCTRAISECTLPRLTAPVLAYSHGINNCAVAGGYVYRGQRYPSLQGMYFFGDYCSGHVWDVKTPIPHAANATLLGQTPYQIVSFGEDEDGELYLVDLAGNIVKITAKGVQ